LVVIEVVKVLFNLGTQEFFRVGQNLGVNFQEFLEDSSPAGSG